MKNTLTASCAPSSVELASKEAGIDNVFALTEKVRPVCAGCGPRARAVIGIDPGPETSGIVYWDGRQVQIAVPDITNAALRHWLRTKALLNVPIAIEAITCYGMPVGAETFQTCYWIGRLCQVWEDRCGVIALVPRREVKLFWCANSAAKDPNIRQAILDAFGGKSRAVGLKARPGPLYAVHGHCWSALALALAYAARK